MSSATRTAVADDAPDPTLATLVPRRSVARNLVIAAAAAVVLAGAGLSPHVLRPSVVPAGPSGTLTPIAPHDVVSVTQLDPDGWPHLTVTAVEDMPGATVTGAWVLADAIVQAGGSVDPATITSGLDYLHAAYPAGDLGAASTLPYRVSGGGSAWLVVVWHVTDCSALTEGARPTIDLRSAVGSSRSEQLDSFVGPAYDLATLADAGVCPSA